MDVIMHGYHAWLSYMVIIHGSYHDWLLLYMVIMHGIIHDSYHKTVRHEMFAMIM